MDQAECQAAWEGRSHYLSGVLGEHRHAREVLRQAHGHVEVLAQTQLRGVASQDDEGRVMMSDFWAAFFISFAIVAVLGTVATALFFFIFTVDD